MRRGLLAFAAIVCGGLSLFDLAAHGEDRTAARAHRVRRGPLPRVDSSSRRGTICFSPRARPATG